jgi:anti-anti-sigma regulatory factor
MHAFAERVLSGPEGDVVVDLGACTYVDSTFLGGLVSLFKRHCGGNRTDHRFAIYAPPATRQNLFGTSRLDRVFPFVDELPLTGVESLPLEVQTTTSREELGHYIVECHRRLAELGGPDAEAFGRVADALADELTLRRRS